MSQQRMAGGNEFQSKMKQAASGPGGQEHKTQPASLKGADAWNTQVQREQYTPSTSGASAASKTTAGSSNLQDYINVSKTATAANGNFSIDSANKYVNNSRSQGNINKQQNEGFSANRISGNAQFANQQQDLAARKNEGFSSGRVSGNVQFANQQQDNNLQKNEGFAMKTTNSFVNNAKAHSDERTSKSQDFARSTTKRYLQQNNRITNVDMAALDKQIRSAPIVDQAYSTVQGNNTYGDMYAYGRKELPGFNRPDPMKGVESPDFQGMYNQTKKDLDNYKV